MVWINDNCGCATTTRHAFLLSSRRTRKRRCPPFASVRNRDGTSRAAACKSFTRVCVIANELERGYMPCRLDVGRNVFTRGIRSIGTTSILLSAICIYVRIYIYTHKCIYASIERANWIREGSFAIALHRLKPLLPLRIGGTEEYRRESESSSSLTFGIN